MAIPILLVDDNPSFLSICRNFLKSLPDLDVYVSDSVANALTMTKTINPDLVLMDIHFGDDETAGISCVEEMRDMGFMGMVCMLTCDVSLEKILDSVAAGADDYWVKGRIGNLPWELKNLFNHNNRSTSIRMHPVGDGAYLRSRGLEQKQIEMLMRIYEYGFPLEKLAADKFNLKRGTYNKRISRIRKRLGLENIPEVSKLMTLLSVCSKRRNRRRKKLYQTSKFNLKGPGRLEIPMSGPLKGLVNAETSSTRRSSNYLHLSTSNKKRQ